MSPFNYDEKASRKGQPSSDNVGIRHILKATRNKDEEIKEVKLFLAWPLRDTTVAGSEHQTIMVSK